MEFCYNNAENSTIKQIPFYAVYSKHPTNNFPTAVEVANPVAEDFVKSLTEMQSVMQENIVVAQS